jgi:hypothetical protein
MQGKIITIIPKSFGNWDKISPIEIDVKVPTHGERRGMLKLAEFARSATGELRVDLGRSVSLQEQAIRAHVTAVRNYVEPVCVWKDGKATEHPAYEIATAEDLLKYGEGKYIAETYPGIVEPELLDRLSKKNWNERQVSTPGNTQASPGPAETVEPKVST